MHEVFGVETPNEPPSVKPGDEDNVMQHVPWSCVVCSMQSELDVHSIGARRRLHAREVDIRLNAADERRGARRAQAQTVALRWRPLLRAAR